MLTGQQVEFWLFRIRLQLHYIVSHLLMLQVTVCCYFHFDTKDLQLYVLRPSPHIRLARFSLTFNLWLIFHVVLLASSAYVGLSGFTHCLLLTFSEAVITQFCHFFPSTSLLHSTPLNFLCCQTLSFLDTHSVSVMSCSPLVSLYIQ